VNMTDCQHLLPKLLCRRCQVAVFGPPPDRSPPVAPRALSRTSGGREATAELPNIPRKKIERYRPKGIIHEQC
jgi:hypothetical protein